MAEVDINPDQVVNEDPFEDDDADFDDAEDDDFSMGDTEEYLKDPVKLPEGIKKEVIAEATEGGRCPKAGDEVVVHYTGSLTDGSVFDSSVERGTPFNFTLGKGQVIQGWDVGVGTMKIGEKAKFTLSPEYGYGESGSPPKIPENATLIFEIELISFKSLNDLFGDGGVVKTVEIKSDRWEKPKIEDEVVLCYSLYQDEAKTVELESKELVYTVSEESEGLPVPLFVFDKIVMDMKMGEKSTIVIDPRYSGRKDACVFLSLELVQIREVSDISLEMGSKIVFKKTLKDDSGAYETASDFSSVTLKLEACLDKQTGAKLLEAQELVVLPGEGVYSELIEVAAAKLKKNEEAQIWSTHPETYTDIEGKLPFIEGALTSYPVFHFTCVNFENSKQSYSMTAEEKLDLSGKLKESGTKILKRTLVPNLRLAIFRYSSAVKIFEFDNDKSDPAKLLITKQCNLNLSLCHLKTKDWEACKECCDKVIASDPENQKALLRRGQAFINMQCASDALFDLKRLVGLDKTNVEARRLYAQAREMQKVEDDAQKTLFSRMCKDIGKNYVTQEKDVAQDTAAPPTPEDDVTKEVDHHSLYI